MYSLAQAKDLDINCEFEDTYVCAFARDYDVKRPSWEGQLDPLDIAPEALSVE